MKHSEDWWEKYTTGYALLEHPILLVDHHFKPQWLNAAAQRLGLERKFPAAVERQFFLENNSTFFDEYHDNTTIPIPESELPGARMEYCLKPVPNAAELQGFVVTLQHQSPPEQLWEADERRATSLEHQLRGPLSSIFSALTGLRGLNDEYEDPTLRGYTNTIAMGSYRMLRTTLHIARFHRFQYGTMAYRPQRQDIAGYLDQLCRAISLMVERAGKRFSFTIPPEAMPAWFDRDILAAIVLELVSNALKFSGEDGALSIALEAGAGNALITVEDNGLGVAQDILSRVFEPYFSYDPSTQNICGDGLGLCLCWEGARLHGGSVALHSREGGGTRVVLSLPFGVEGELQSLSVRDMAADSIYDRFSDLYVILSDVCKVPEQ